MQLTERQLHNFWSKVDVKDSNSCWPWLASRKKFRGVPRYGQFKLNGRPYMAHRVAYAIATGKDPGECYVLHTCDNPVCCNPLHLREGTHQDNMDDMTSKGRQGKKLNPLVVRQIRASQGTGTQREVADRFGVSHRTVGHIWNCQTWTTI